MATVTARQKVALDEMTAEARTVHGTDCQDWREWYPWITSYADETRPGRGHTITAVYADSDHIVHIMLDPYGSGSMSVGSIDWTHSSSDEECNCEPCVRYREDEA